MIRVGPAAAPKSWADRAGFSSDPAALAPPMPPLGPDTLALATARPPTRQTYLKRAMASLRYAIAVAEQKVAILDPPKATLGSSAAERLPESKTNPRPWQGFRNILKSPAPAAREPGHFETSSALLLIARRLRDEEASTTRLTPEDRQAYWVVRDALTEDVEGRLALQELVLSGRLTGAKASDGRSAWVHLARLVNQELPTGLNLRNLLGPLLEEVAEPATISQGQAVACAPAVLAMLLSRQQPGELVRLVAGLASKEGKVALANGEIVTRPRDWHLSYPGRSLGQQLFQVALTNYAVRPYGLVYNHIKDEISSPAEGITIREGLSVLESNDMYEALTGQAADPYAADVPGEIDESLESLVAQIAVMTARGYLVPVGLTFPREGGSGGHKILVYKIASDRVYYLNPNSTEEFMSLPDFMHRFRNANLPTPLSPKPKSRGALPPAE